MTKEAVLIKADGTETIVIPKNNTDFTLEECYSLIGCEYVELVPLGSKKIMIVDEDGIAAKKTVNQKATEMAAGKVFMNGGIRGDVIVCHQAMFR